MQKLKILILHFPNLNNYGTGMMGLITIQAIANKYGAENVDFYCDFNQYAEIEAIKQELQGNIHLFPFINKQRQRILAIKNPVLRKIYMLFATEAKEFDKAIVLGGDDISEYYSKTAAFHILFNKWKTSLFTKVILLGQTLGPFTTRANRFAASVFLRRLTVISRDTESCNYLNHEFKIKAIQGADLALADLPLQHNKTIEAEILEKYGLTPNSYITMVVSGMYEQYCPSLATYLTRHKEIIASLCANPLLAEKKIVLLAHTFLPYGNEPALIEQVYNSLPATIQGRVVVIQEKVLQTRARFILGNGFFTITGRMHAAVSTFQMGKPAICLSYSIKYKGVIGDSIGRYDLVVEARNLQIWEHNQIVYEVENKVNYLLGNYDRLTTEIGLKVNEQKNIVETCLKLM